MRLSGESVVVSCPQPDDDEVFLDLHRGVCNLGPDLSELASEPADTGVELFYLATDIIGGHGSLREQGPCQCLVGGQHTPRSVYAGDCPLGWPSVPARRPEGGR